MYGQGTRAPRAHTLKKHEHNIRDRGVFVSWWFLLRQSLRQCLPSLQTLAALRLCAEVCVIPLATARICAMLCSIIVPIPGRAIGFFTRCTAAFERTPFRLPNEGMRGRIAVWSYTITHLCVIVVAVQVKSCNSPSNNELGRPSKQYFVK